MAKTDKNLSNTNPATEALIKAASELSQDSNSSNPIWRKQLKKGLGILGSLAFVFLLVASIFIFGKPYDTACQVSMTVELNGIKMEDNGVYNVTPGDIITVEASSSEAAIAFIGYYFSSLDEDNIENIQSVDSSKIEITVPSVAQDTTLILSIEAVAENDNGEDNTTTKTGWKNYALNISSTCQVNMYAELNGTKMEDGGTYEVRPGDIITIEASSSESTIEMIGYCWGYDNDSEIIDERSNRITIIVPENDEGYTELLRVEAVASNDNGSANTETKTGWKKYYLKYLDAPKCQVNMYAELNGQKLEDNKRYLVNPGDVIIVEASSSEATIALISYYFAPLSSYDDKITVYSNRVEIVIPDGEPGSLQNLLVEPVAANDDGSANTVTKTGWKKFTLEYDNRVANKSSCVLVNNVEVKNGSTTKVRAGATVAVSIAPAEKVKTLNYKLGDSEAKSISSSFAQFSIPHDAAPGETYTIKINALFDDGYFINNKDEEHTSSEVYKFEIIN